MDIVQRKMPIPGPVGIVDMSAEPPEEWSNTGKRIARPETNNSAPNVEPLVYPSSFEPSPMEPVGASNGSKPNAALPWSHIPVTTIPEMEPASFYQSQGEVFKQQQLALGSSTMAMTPHQDQGAQ